ncbi:hypothetical protein BDW66DRAFT_144583 [Aspergillus desertorum]
MTATLPILQQSLKVLLSSLRQIQKRYQKAAIAKMSTSTSAVSTATSTSAVSPDNIKRQPQPSASTNQVPTVGSLRSFKRSVSYHISLSNPEEHGPERVHANSPAGRKLDEAGCNQMMKASLTGLLNCQEVKNEARERTVQNMLMSTERDIRRARRAILKTGVLGAKRSANASPDLAAEFKRGSVDGLKGNK